MRFSEHDPSLQDLLRIDKCIKFDTGYSDT
jgi:hypothetical protein